MARRRKRSLKLNFITVLYHHLLAICVFFPSKHIFEPFFLPLFLLQFPMIFFFFCSRSVDYETHLHLYGCLTPHFYASQFLPDHWTFHFGWKLISIDSTDKMDRLVGLFPLCLLHFEIVDERLNVSVWQPSKMNDEHKAHDMRREKQISRVMTTSRCLTLKTIHFHFDIEDERRQHHFFHGNEFDSEEFSCFSFFD